MSCSDAWVDLKTKHLETRGADSRIFASDVFGIVWCFERLADFSERFFDSRDCFARRDSPEAAVMNSFIRHTIVVEEQVSATDSVLVLVDPVR